jgi:hypothetical protein
MWMKILIKLCARVSDSWDAVLGREGLDLFSDQLDLLI